MTVVLNAQEIHSFYGKSHILHGVSLEVKEGEIVAVLGRNGAGKTTTVRSLMGLTPARMGKIEIFGRETTRWPTHRVAALGVGYVPEGRKIFGNLTVLENLKVPQARPGPGTRSRRSRNRDEPVQGPRGRAALRRGRGALQRQRGRSPHAA